MTDETGWIGRPAKESGVPADEQVANSREYGGALGQDDKVGDAGTTTGTANNDLFVGRAAGDDLGYAGDTGAEAAPALHPRPRRTRNVRFRVPIAEV